MKPFHKTYYLFRSFTVNFLRFCWFDHKVGQRSQLLNFFKLQLLSLNLDVTKERIYLLLLHLPLNTGKSRESGINTLIT